jgi:hypothetical protein
MATTFAAAVQMQVTGVDPFLGANFVYEQSGSYLSMAYWNNAQSQAQSCANCMPSNLDSQYAYAVSSSAPPSAASSIDLASLAPSLMTTAVATDTTLASTDTMINGAHSRPMSRRVAVGEKTAWIAGDLGRDDHGRRDGSMGLAEVGGGYNFGAAQINLSAGKIWNKQHTAFGGSIDADGQYLMLEGIIPVSEVRGIYATVGAYGHWGTTDIRRAYLNAGVVDTSVANPNTHTYGMRARLDWENAFAVQAVKFTPYADVSYAHSRMNGYTESGGGLPATFDSRSTNSTELRVGLNSALPLAATKLNLVANLETAHRFDPTGAPSTGQIGAMSFSVAGQSYQSTWLKGGIGVEGMLGAGKASVMLNGTSQSGMPNAWLAASYQMAF